MMEIISVRSKRVEEGGDDGREESQNKKKKRNVSGCECYSS